MPHVPPVPHYQFRGPSCAAGCRPRHLPPDVLELLLALRRATPLLRTYSGAQRCGQRARTIRLGCQCILCSVCWPQKALTAGYHAERGHDRGARRVQRRSTIADRRSPRCRLAEHRHQLLRNRTVLLSHVGFILDRPARHRLMPKLDQADPSLAVEPVVRMPPAR